MDDGNTRLKSGGIHISTEGFNFTLAINRAGSPDPRRANPWNRCRRQIGNLPVDDRICSVRQSDHYDLFGVTRSPGNE